MFNLPHICGPTPAPWKVCLVDGKGNLQGTGKKYVVTTNFGQVAQTGRAGF